MNRFSIGVDLGGTNLRIAAVDDKGALVEKVTLGTKVSLGRDHVIDDMCDAIQHLSDKYRKSSALLGIGIGVPGIIDMQTGLLRESPNLPGWADYPVRAEIERRLKTIVILENDANVAALGEQWLGAAKDYADMAMLTLGTGVGGGIVMNGLIWRGANGMAGEFGHATVEPDGHPCGCGNIGCLEQYASASSQGSDCKKSRIRVGQRFERRSGVQRENYLQPRHSRRRRCSAYFQLCRSLFGHHAFDLGEFIEPAHLRDWRRSVERMGGLLACHLPRVAPACAGLCRHCAARSISQQRGRVRARSVRTRSQDNHYARAVGERCRTIRCSPSADAY